MLVVPYGFEPDENSLVTDPTPDCVEVGTTRVVGGIRSQKFGVAYRPDGVRFAYDNKTLNSRNSLGRNLGLPSFLCSPECRQDGRF